MNLVAALLFLIGLSFSALGVVSLVEARRTLRWRIAKGTVVHNEVLVMGEHFVGVVRYSYALAAGTVYRGGGPIPESGAYGAGAGAGAGGGHMQGRLESATSKSREEAEDVLRRFPVGDRLDVRYDPARPTRSVVDGTSGEARFGGWMAVLGLALAAVAGVLAAVG